jgi:hypothetical protein
MEIYISIDGVLRNFMQKFEYHYQNYFLESEVNESQEKENFEYKIKYPIQNDNILNYFMFQSKEEFDHFCYMEFPLELFGHAPASYSGVMLDLNKLIYSHTDINFTVIGVDEFARAKSSTLFFLSKNSFLGNNIRFIKSDDIIEEWKRCDMWITDSREIIEKCPINKTAIKFSTDYNQYFYHKIEINKLTKIDELCLLCSEKTITSTLMKLLTNVASVMKPKSRKELI